MKTQSICNLYLVIYKTGNTVQFFQVTEFAVLVMKKYLSRYILTDCKRNIVKYDYVTNLKTSGTMRDTMVKKCNLLRIYFNLASDFL